MQHLTLRFASKGVKHDDTLARKKGTNPLGDGSNDPRRPTVLDSHDTDGDAALVKAASSPPWAIRSVTAALTLWLAGGCATAPPFSPHYPPRTTLTLAASPGCAGHRCRCRPLEGEQLAEENIAPGTKRFELRLPRSTSDIWVEVEGRGVLFKPGALADPACAYVDLAPGKHRVVVRAENRDAEVGLQAGLTVSEYGTAAGPGWYRSFHLACGHAASRCTRAELSSWRAFQARLPRGVLDPCGSVMVKNVAFGGRRAERLDREYQDMTVRFTLQVYEFAPHHPPASERCRGPIKNRPTGS